MAKTEVIGIDEVIELLKDVEKVSIRSVTKAAKVGAKIARDDARANAPVDTGQLKRGIKMKLERKRTQGKRVYSIGFYGKSGKGEEFVKYSKSGKRSFYPVSQEYGWVDKNGKRHEGKKFLRNAIDKNREQINRVVLQTLADELKGVR